MNGPRRRQGLEGSKIEARALSDRWAMSPEVRAKVVKRLIDVVDPAVTHAIGAPGHREVTSAAKALVDADRLNLDYHKFDFATAAAPPPDDDFDVDLDLDLSPD